MELGIDLDMQNETVETSWLGLENIEKKRDKFWRHKNERVT